MDINGFLKSIEGLADNSLRAYKQTLWQLKAVLAGDEPTKEEIYAFLKQYPSASLHRHKAAIKAYLEYIRPDDRWPFTSRQFRAPKRKLPRYVLPDVVQAMIDAADDADVRMFLKTLFTLGCRISELMAITAADITPMGVMCVTKGGHTRLQPVTHDFQVELASYAKARKGKGRIFPRPYAFYRTTLRLLGAEVGKPDMTLHMLRHARAIDLIRKGKGQSFVKDFLGHASIATTAIYTELTGGDLVEGLEEVEAGGLTV